MLPEVAVPLATLQGRAERPGDNRLLGALDPALARDLAAAAARSPRTRWEVTIVDDQGYAVGHGLARPGTRQASKPQPPGPTLLRAARTGQYHRNRDTTAAAGSRAALRGAAGRVGVCPSKANGTAPGLLTLPGGRELAVRFDVVPTHACDHRYRVNTYEPGDRLRRLVQVRDHECTFPTCSRPAHESDFEHAVPYDQGGETDACNAGARSRRCHQVKQSHRLDGHPAQARLARCGPHRPAEPTSRNHGGTSHDRGSP